MKKAAKILMILLMVCLLSEVNVSDAASKKATLKTKKITMTVGQKKKVVLKNKKKNATYTFVSSNKKRAIVNKKGQISAKKAGTVKITVKEKLKKKTRLVGKVTVNIKKKKTQKPQENVEAVNPTTPVTPTTVTNPTSVTQPVTQPSVADPTITQPTVPTTAPTEPTMVPIEELLENTNTDTPSGYTRKQDDVTYGEVVNITYESEATGSVRKAKVLLPAGYTEDKKYPVLYMMHGIGGTEESLLKDDDVEYVIGNAIASGDAEEMIVVFPNGCANETGLPPVGEDFYSLAHYKAYDNFVNDLELALMPYMADNFSVAEGRENTAVAGFSMGGRVALHVAFTLQDSFRYAGALCPAFGILEYTNNGVHEEGLFTEDTFTLEDEYMEDTLILIAAGPNDGIVRDEPKRYHETLEKNGVPHMYYETLGGENNTGDGGHTAAVYQHGLYNLMSRMFKK